jgi:hypothetical protein
VAVVTGCASTARTPQADASIKTVTVVSMLHEDAPIARVGLTVFNNAVTRLPQGGSLNKIATETIEARIRTARPSWEIKPSGVDSVALSAKFRQGGTSWTSHTGKVKDDLVAIARKTGSDAMLVVSDMTLENSPGRGVGVVLRALPGTKPTVTIHAHVMLQLVDRDGNEITNRTGDNIVVPASQLGLTDDLASVDSGNNREKLTEAMRRQLAESLAKSAAHMGY